MTSNNGILIVGGTPHGLQAALTLAHCGRKVTIAENNFEIAGPPKGWSEKSKRHHQYILAQVSCHPLIEISTESRIMGIKEAIEGMEVQLTQRPRWILPELCVNCNKCLISCPVELPNGRKPIFELRAPTTMAIDKREKAPCRSACPIDMNPQGYVALIAQGRIDEAFELILDENPLPGICGRVCHHPCEMECRRKEIDEPIAICALKRFVADEILKKRKGLGIGNITPVKGPRIAVIGSGPAGLTAANDLARAGFRATIIESEGRPGGLLSYGIAPYRLPRQTIEGEIEGILALGVDLRLNSAVVSWEDIEKLKAEGFRAVLLATGASKDLNMNIKGEGLEGIYGCVSFLKGMWTGKTHAPLGRVVVIGGGNAAVEASRAVIRSVAQSVTLIYRRTRMEMPADPHEVEQALEEGIKPMYLTTPVEFEGNGNRLARIKCIKMKLDDMDASGRLRPIPIDGSEFLINADTAIISIGQDANSPYGRGHLRLKRGGIIEVARNGETNIPGVYASGDVVSGPSTVVEAMASGRRAARAIILSLKPELRQIPDHEFESAREKYDPVPKDIPKQKRRPIPHRRVSKRIKDYKEVIGPFSAKEAVKEASRCLQCSICSECLRCETACDMEAIRHDRVSTRRSLHFSRIIVADSAQVDLELDFPLLTRVERHGKKDFWARALVAGRAAAMEALSKTYPAKTQPLSRRSLGNGDQKIGIFLCSCSGTLNENGLLDKMIAPLTKIQGIAHVEVLMSACHPEKGRRIEEVINEKGLNGALIASCVCCHIDFSCESCTDQRIRLKNRLFREGGYDPKDITLVNIKETCLIPYKNDHKKCIDKAMRIIRSGLWQLREHKEWTFKNEQAHTQAIVLGATEAGIAAAKGLKGQFSSVVLVDDLSLTKKDEKDLRGWGIDLVSPARPLRIDGQSGSFTLIFEKTGSLLSKEDKENSGLFTQNKTRWRKSIDTKAFDEDPRYQKVQGDIIILGRSEFRNIPYKSDAFAREHHLWGHKAFGTLETGIPGVYMASWSQAMKISGQTLGKSAAGEALEGTFQKPDESKYLVAHVDPEFCRGCGRCADVCPEGAARLEESARGVAFSWIEPRLCTGCGVCVAECPTGAIILPESEQGYFEKVINEFLA